MIIRCVSSAALGLLVATGLLWLMQFLIDIGPEVFVEHRRELRLAWLGEQRPEVIEDDREPPDRPPPPADPPRDHRLPGERDEWHRVELPTIGGPEDPSLSRDVPGITPADGPLVAMMTLRPVYPVRAASLGLEGYVIVQFDVNELGGVVNLTVVESSHRLFEKSAIEAARRSKFRPRVVDGVAVVTTGVRKLFRFEMEK